MGPLQAKAIGETALHQISVEELIVIAKRDGTLAARRWLWEQFSDAIDPLLGLERTDDQRPTVK